MKKIKIAALALLAGLSLGSCTDVLFDNVNPDKAHDITAKDGLPVVVFYAQQQVYDYSEYYIYLSQCLTTGGKSSIGSYSYKSEWEFLTMNRHPQWRRHFYDIGVNAKNLIDNAAKINSPNYELIARTIKLMSTQLCTDNFGDMPQSEAYMSNSPKYDTQASIYAWMLQECDDLIAMYEDDALVNCPTNQDISALDRVYHGDLSKWKGLVYAMKARILLRNIPNIDRSNAMCDKIIAAADAAINQWRSGDLLYGAWFGNEPRYKFDGGTNEQNAPWSEAQPIINSWESRKNMLDSAIPSKFFMIDCLGLLEPDSESKCGQYQNYQGYANDPRASLLMQAQNGPLSATSTNTVYKLRYLDNNLGMGSSFKAINYPKLHWGAYASGKDAYNPIFTMEELYFIKAEALYWKNDKVQACQLAKEATKWNIQRHLDDFIARNPNPAVDPATNKIYPGGIGASGIVYEQEKYWNAQLAAFFENEEFYSTGARPRLLVGKVSDKGNKHYFFNETEYTLYDLMTQKYIAMYMQPEQWTDLRRYHYSNKRNNYGIGENQEIVYPALRRPYNLYAPYWIDGLTETEKENTWIQRINYDPETEEKYNRAELERLGAYKNYKWLRVPMIWAQDYGVRSSLTEE